MIVKKILLILTSLFTLLHLFIFNSYQNDIDKTKNEISKKELNFGSMTSLEDGAVYFIRSKLDNNMVFDIPGSNYSDDTQVEIYNWLGWGNQRFVLEKSFDNTYRIRPLDINRMYLSVKNNNSNNNNKVVLKTEKDYNNKTLLSDRFRITYDSTYGAFKISTAISDYSKYVGLNNYNTNNKNYLVQKDYDSSNEQYFMWTFEKNSTLGINVNNYATIPANSSKWFLLNTQYSVNYYIELKHSSSTTSKLSIHRDDNNSTLIDEVINTEDGTEEGVRLLVSATAFETIKVKVTNLSSTSRLIKIWVYPEKSVLMTTMYDYGKNKIDSVTKLLDSIPDLVSTGMYPIIQTNTTTTYALQTGMNGKKLINSELYFDIHHGSEGETFFYNGKEENGGSIDILNMPNFTGTKFTFWGSCKSATISENHDGSGYSSNLALEAVNKGANSSIGFNGDVLSVSMPYFVNKFIEKYSITQNVTAATQYASSETNSKYWVQLAFVSAAKKPYLYIRKSNGSIELYNGNTGDIMNNVVDSNMSVDNLSNSFEINSSSFSSKYIKIDNIYTNLPYTSSNWNYVNDNLNKYKNIENYDEANFMLYANSKFYLLSIKMLENQNFQIVDLISKKNISENELLELSTLRKGDII